MNIPLLILSAISFEAMRAKSKILSSITSPPDYNASGPLVSAIIIAYNEEDYLPALLTSIRNQTYENIETIVVDNESNDDTRRLAALHGATLLSNNEFNLSRSRNIGAYSASGDILAFIDADTVLDRNVIERTAEEIGNGADLVIPNKCSTDSHIQSMFRLTKGWLADSFNGCYIGVSRNAFYEVDGFNENNPSEGEDEEFCEAIALIGQVSHIRTCYVGTSARREKVEGYIKEKHFEARAIRNGGNNV